MKALHDDKVKVSPKPMFDQVWLSTVIDDVEGELMLTPKQARKLARKINQAASAIEIRQEGRARG